MSFSDNGRRIVAPAVQSLQSQMPRFTLDSGLDVIDVPMTARRQVAEKLTSAKWG